MTRFFSQIVLSEVDGALEPVSGAPIGEIGAT
jgi:hypothetical protein